MSVLDEYYGSITEYEYQKRQERKRARERQQKRKLNAEIIKVLGDVEDEIDKLEDGISSYSDDRPWVYKDEVLEIIEQKIAELKGDKE